MGDVHSVHPRGAEKLAREASLEEEQGQAAEGEGAAARMGALAAGCVSGFVLVNGYFTFRDRVLIAQKEMEVGTGRLTLSGEGGFNQTTHCIIVVARHVLLYRGVCCSVWTMRAFLKEICPIGNNKVIIYFLISR